MTLDEMRAACRQRPFVPFRIRVTEGPVDRIGHPEMVLVPPEGRTLAIDDADRGGIAVIDLLLVHVLEFESQASEPSR